MILRYDMNDGLGNRLTLTVQGADRNECDQRAWAEIRRTRRLAPHGNIRASEAEMTDLTNVPIISCDYYNHEIGETTSL